METDVEKARYTCRWLEWLGHVARMPDYGTPKSMLFSWFTQPCPRCGPRKRRRNVVHKDLKDIDVDESEWYEKAMRTRAG